MTYHISHSIRGKRAQSYGASFEKLFLVASRNSGVAITRFPDGCRVIGKNQLIRIHTPFDWIITHKGKTALIDTKTIDAKSFTHSKIVEHQIREMIFHETKGALAGYVIWLREIDAIIFVSALKLSTLINERGSILPSQPYVTTLGSAANFNARLIFEEQAP